PTVGEDRAARLDHRADEAADDLGGEVGNATDRDRAALSTFDRDEEDHVHAAEVEGPRIELDQIAHAHEARPHDRLAQIDQEVVGGDVGHAELTRDPLLLEIEIAAGEAPEERHPALDRDLARERRAGGHPDEGAATCADEGSGTWSLGG